MKKVFVLLMGLFVLVDATRAAGGTDTNAVTATVRAFLSAAMTMDLAAVREHALPHADLDILGEGPPPPPPVMARMRATFSQATCRFLKAGEVIPLPGGRELTVAADQVTPGRCLVQPLVGGSPMPLPLTVVKTGVGWKVDASSIVAARKAAAEAREKRR